MWYLHVPVGTWLKLYPGLKAYFNYECSRCGDKKSLADAKAKPFIRKDMAGLELEDCSCGQRGGWIMTPRTKELCDKYRKDYFAMQDLLNSQ